MPQRLQYQNVALRLISNSYEEREFIASLFRVPDIKLHYTLRDDHAANIYSFVEYQAEVNARHRGFHFIIEDKTLNPVGILTAEVNQDPTVDPYWNVGFAVQPDARNKGYAKNALQGLQDQLSTFNIKTLVLDIPLLAGLSATSTTSIRNWACAPNGSRMFMSTTPVWRPS